MILLFFYINIINIVIINYIYYYNLIILFIPVSKFLSRIKLFVYFYLLFVVMGINELLINKKKKRTEENERKIIKKKRIVIIKMYIYIL